MSQSISEGSIVFKQRAVRRGLALRQLLDLEFVCVNQHTKTERDIVPWRKSNLLAGEPERRHLKIPGPSRFEQDRSQARLTRHKRWQG